MMRRVGAEWSKVGAAITYWRASDNLESAPGRRVRRPPQLASSMIDLKC
jgi:hypothetical protein